MNRNSVFYLEQARLNKNRIPNSPLDTAQKCKTLAETYDLAISGSISAHKPLGIEELIEWPFLISSELCDSGSIDETTRRLVFCTSKLYSCNQFFRFMDVLVQIYMNFWTENKDNIHYKAIYMIHESIRALKPHDWFCLPKIDTILEQCTKDESDYPFWGKGNGY